MLLQIGFVLLIFNGSKFQLVSMAQANLETVLAFELAQEDYDAITDIDFQLRLVDGIRFLRPEGPFRCLPLLSRHRGCSPD